MVRLLFRPARLVRAPDLFAVKPFSIHGIHFVARLVHLEITTSMVGQTPPLAPYDTLKCCCQKYSLAELDYRDYPHARPIQPQF